MVKDVNIIIKYGKSTNDHHVLLNTFFYMTDTLLRVVLHAHASPGPERDASGRRVLDIGHLERRRNSSHAELAVVLLLMRNGHSLSLGRGQIATEEYLRAFISGK
jgi:hypothetical protein